MDSIQVAVAVIADRGGRILIAQRPGDAHQGGLWEFPGGKVEPDETVSDALIRECDEELGIQVRTFRPLICVHHDYGDRRVVLEVFKVTRFTGTAHGAEGQPLAWASPAELSDYPMPVADRPIINAIRLPDRYMITPAVVDDRRRYFDQLQTGLEQGVRLVQFRVSEYKGSRDRLAAETVQQCHALGAQVLINEDLALARAAGADGIHLKSRQFGSLSERPAGMRWVGGSCHDQAELASLRRLGADFAVLSPVKATASHPDAQPLGWQAFADLARHAAMPVFALGGLCSADRAEAWRCGAQGVAAIGGLWGVG